MSRLRLPTVLLFAALAAGCNFTEKFESYCERTGNCACGEGGCCINEGRACGEGSCCEGLTCASGVCRATVAGVRLELPPGTAFPPTFPNTAAELEIPVFNRGLAVSEPLAFSFTGDRDQFQFFGGDCEGQRLEPGVGCKASLLFAPSRGGSFEIELHLTSGQDEIVHRFQGASQATVTLELNGAGSDVQIRSDPAGIDCPAGSCTGTFTLGAVTFTESHAPGRDFSGWKIETDQASADLGKSQSVTLWLTRPVHLKANFQPWLWVSPISGGWLTSDPPGLDCGWNQDHPVCSAALSGAVQLTAHPDPGYSEVKWTGACEGSGPGLQCDLVISGVTQVGAVF